MPSKAQILNILATEATEATPLHRNKLAEKLGENTYRSFQTQLDRFEKQELIQGTPDHEYYITELGLKELSDEPMVTEELNEEKLGTTEYQQFISLGKLHGVSPPELIKVTADHVWKGGDFKDLDWVAKAFDEMGVRTDLRNRWWHSWRVYLHQPIPTRIPAEIMEVDTKTGVKKESKGKRNYILDAEDKPVYVGEGYGDLDYEDALELSKMRTSRGARVAPAVAQTPGSMADDMVKLFNAFQTFMGDKSQGKSYMVRQGEEGIQVEEVDPGRPMIINYPQGGDNKQKQTYFVNQEGEVQEVQPGQPIIIKQAAPVAAAPSQGVQYLVDKQTGQVTQVQPGQPIVIQAQAPQQQYPYTPIQMKDKDGNPMVLDLSTFIRLEEHRDKQRHDEESHETKQEIAKAFKDLIGKATSALGHMEK